MTENIVKDLMRKLTLVLFVNEILDFCNLELSLFVTTYQIFCFIYLTLRVSFI